jgi:hypothetical protein
VGNDLRLFGSFDEATSDLCHNSPESPTQIGVSIVSIDTDKSDKHSKRGSYCVTSGTQPITVVLVTIFQATQMGDTDRGPDLCRFIL